MTGPIFQRGPTAKAGRRRLFPVRPENGGLPPVGTLGRMAGSEPGLPPCRHRLALAHCHCSIVASTRPAETASSSRR
jgi:hypothetical protein